MCVHVCVHVNVVCVHMCGNCGAISINNSPTCVDHQDSICNSITHDNRLQLYGVKTLDSIMIWGVKCEWLNGKAHPACFENYKIQLFILAMPRLIIAMLLLRKNQWCDDVTPIINLSKDHSGHLKLVKTPLTLTLTRILLCPHGFCKPCHAHKRTHLLQGSGIQPHSIGMEQGAGCSDSIGAQFM